MAIFERHSFDPTAFMSGQMISKLWLCEELEKLVRTPQIIWILGGWYATTNFLLRTRGNLKIKKCMSFDQDPEATQGALILNENSIYLDAFDAVTKDINELSYPSYGRSPDIIINTSCEHIEDNTWFGRIPEDTMVVLQSNDMPHDDHCSNLTSVEDLMAMYPMSKILFKGTKHVAYPDWSFNRFMAIGLK